MPCAPQVDVRPLFRAGLGAAIVTLLSLVASAGCSEAETGDGSRGPASRELRGLYIDTDDEGTLGDLAIVDDGVYVLRRHGCYERSCLEIGDSRVEEDATGALTLILKSARTHTERSLHVEVLAATDDLVADDGDRLAQQSRALEISTGTVSPQDTALGASGDKSLTAGKQQVIEKTDGGKPQKLRETITAAKISKSLVSLDPDRKNKPLVGPNGNDLAAPKGQLPGVLRLTGPTSSEQNLVHPPGSSITIAKKGDEAFSDDAAIALQYGDKANIYNSHGMPGALMGGVPGAKVKELLDGSKKPLIVASCFSGAPLRGGSTIRRLVSSYSKAPLAASERVIGCTGFASGSTQGGLGCSGVWVNANGRALTEQERAGLSLRQNACARNTVDDSGQIVTADCKNP